MICGFPYIIKVLRAGTLAGLLVSLATFASAEPVKVRAAPHQDYGRIVFNWATPVPFTVNASGTQLVVSFGQNIEPDLSGVVRALGKYLSAASPGPDGRSVVFAMKDSFKVGGFDMGAAVVIDIVDKKDAQGEAPAPATQPSAQAQTQAQPATETAPAAQPSGPSIGVRSGIHADYTRIVFDWPNKVSYTVNQTPGQAVVTFSSPARLQITELQRRLPKLISGVSTQAAGNGVSLTLSIPETSRIKDFFSGSKVVIDVLKPTGEPLPEQQVEKADPVPEPSAEAVAQEIPKTTPESKPAVDQKAPVAPAPPAQPVKPVDTVQAGAPTADNETQPTALTPPSRPAKSALNDAEQQSLNQIAGVKILGAPEDSGVGAVAGAAPGTPSMPGAGSGIKTIKASAIDSGSDAVGIRIDWDEPVAAAVFRRFGYLWVVFDKLTQMNLDDLRAAGGNLIRSIEQLPNEGATVLRMNTIAGINPSLKRDGLAWILEFRQQPIQPVTAIETTPQPNSPIGARLFLPVTEPGKAIPVTDPAVGDSLIVVPIIPLGHGISRGYDYPQARILPSSQGLVIQPLSDDLVVRPLRQGVEVTSGAGLQISTVAAALAAEVKLDEGGPMIRALTRLFDLDKWSQANLTTFEENKWRYQMAAATAKDSVKEKARMDMARFYFANGFGPEALGVLKIVAEDRPSLAETDEFRGLRGAINVLMGRYEDARADLEHPSLDENDEARFWRATLQAYEGDLFGAASDLRRMAAITRPYPRALKIPLTTLIAEAAIELGDIKQARRYLETLMASQPNPAEYSQITYVEGRLKELSGDFDGAVGNWEEVQDGPHRPSRAKAAVARTELLLKLKKIDEFEAIVELEKLRFAWRGDEFEFDLLRRLGDLYITVGDFRNGLRTMRQAATHFRDHEKAAEVTQDMTDAFASLYLEDRADELAPITAIALYDEFKELTPAGAEGDEMIRRLADRLVDVDLLDRAAALLQGQVEFRLEGEEKARVGAQLTLVHLLAHEYGQALSALDQSEVENMPEELVDQRRHLRARALMGQERTLDALELLKADKTMEADLLRLEMYWNDKDWVQASQSLNRLLRDYEAKPGEFLDDTQARTVLNMAVAMTLSKNERGIDRLRRDFGLAMDDTRFRDAFRLIASPDTLGLINYASIAGKVADVENFKTYMDAYRERLKERKLSALN